MQIKDCTEHARYQLMLGQGEKVLESITAFCSKRAIKSGILSGIGAVRNAKVAYYSLGTKEYRTREFPDDREVVSFIGNIALVEGQPFVHAHISLGDTDLGIIGGHLKEAEVAVTLEIHLITFHETFLRSMDEIIGLNLLNFKRPEL